MTIKTKIILEVEDLQIPESDITNAIKKAWQKKSGNKVADLGGLDIYIKFEEKTAYFVASNGTKGKVSFACPENIADSVEFF